MSTNFDKNNLDTIKELASIGTGNVSIEINKLLNKKIIIDVPDAKILSIETVTSELGGADSLVTIGYYPLSDEIEGTFLIIISDFEKEKLVNKFLSPNNIDFQKFADVIATSFLDSISKTLNTKINIYHSEVNIKK
jgi:chemotaxis protein CheC